MIFHFSLNSIPCRSHEIASEYNIAWPRRCLPYTTFKNESDLDLQDQDHSKNVIFKIKIVPISAASELPFYDIFATQTVPLSKISDDVIACDLWFCPPPIKTSGYAYKIYCVHNVELRQDLVKDDVQWLNYCSSKRLGIIG